MINNLKKWALILVAFMLLVIPNLHIYSSVGSYHIVSQAITANKNYQTLSVNDYWLKNMYGKILYNGVDIYDIISNLTEDLESVTGSRLMLMHPQIIAELNAKEVQRAKTQGYSGKPITKPYAKYDFSGFDN